MLFRSILDANGVPAENFILTKQSSSGNNGGSGSVSAYTITVADAQHGKVASSRKSASAGTTVTLTVTPDKGYELDTLTVTDKNGDKVKVTEKDGKYTFQMPASKVTVEASFANIEGKNPFVDVPDDAYFADAVIWAVGEGITSGTSATTFNPHGICTRAQIVTFLWRFAGSPKPESDAMPFTDVASNAYYYDAALWAVEQGITAGTSGTTFSPDATCTREQIVTFLWRFAGSPKATKDMNGYTDFDAVADYAKEAMRWAVENGIVSGTSATTLSPQSNATRAQVVVILARYSQR